MIWPSTIIGLIRDAAVVDGDHLLHASTAPVPRSISTTTAYVPNG